MTFISVMSLTGPHFEILKGRESLIPVLHGTRTGSASAPGASELPHIYSVFEIIDGFIISLCIVPSFTWPTSYGYCIIFLSFSRCVGYLGLP